MATPAPFTFIFTKKEKAAAAASVPFAWDSFIEGAYARNYGSRYGPSARAPHEVKFGAYRAPLSVGKDLARRITHPKDEVDRLVKRTLSDLYKKS